MRFYFPFLLCFLFAQTAFSQHRGRAVFAEAGGPGVLSANLDMRLGKKLTGFGGRIGIGDFGLFSGQPFIIPVGLNYLAGKNDKHLFEIGAGVGLVPFIYHKDVDPNYIPTKFDEFISNFESTFGYVDIGYRYQPKQNGLFFRVVLTPIINYDFLPYYGGLSIGYKF